MKMREMINRIAIGAQAGVDTREESVALLEDAVSRVLLRLAGNERVAELDALAEEYGIAFEISAGQVVGVAFE